MLADERFVKTYMITEAAITIAHVTAKKSKQLENEWTHVVATVYMFYVCTIMH